MLNKFLTLTALLIFPFAIIFGNPNDYLFDSINYDNLENVISLLEEGADPNLKNEYGETALMRACEYKTGYEMAKALISFGADVNAGDGYGVTSLMKAVENGNRDIVELLLSKGAHANDKTVKNYNVGGITYPKDTTALSIAEKNGYDEIAKILREHGAE